MSERPWMKFYTADWRSDPRLRMCGLAARGLWMEMLAVMHEATPYGHFLVEGVAPDERQIAALVGAPLEQVSALLAELESMGVFSRTRKGVVYSRRMVRDEKKAEIGRKSANRRHGQGSENKPENPLPNGSPTGKPHAYMPEVREKRDANASHKKGTRLSPDWELPREWGQWAVNEGWPAASVRVEAECFRDHWAGKAGKDATKRDWFATWRNWIRNDYARRGPKHGRANDQSAQQRRASEALDAELEYVAKRWADSGGEAAAGADAQDPSDGGGSRSENQNAPIVLLASRR